jgi:hypothetical protein
MDDRADEIWNRAALGGTLATRSGDRALAAVLGLHGLAMSSGLVDALERLTTEEVDAAEAGYRWLGLGAAADVVAAVRGDLAADGMTDEAAEALELRADEDYGHAVPTDDTVLQAFRTRLSAEPDAFA